MTRNRNSSRDEHYSSASLFLNRGVIFFRAYQEIKRNISLPFFPVNYYLLAHSLELFLKGRLRNFGISIEDLANYKLYGHHLVKILNKIEKENLLVISGVDREIISRLNDYYITKELEYCGREGFGLDNLDEVEVLVLKYGKLCGLSDLAFRKAS